VLFAATKCHETNIALIFKHIRQKGHTVILEFIIIFLHNGDYNFFQIMNKNGCPQAACKLKLMTVMSLSNGIKYHLQRCRSNKNWCLYFVILGGNLFIIVTIHTGVGVISWICCNQFHPSLYYNLLANNGNHNTFQKQLFKNCLVSLTNCVGLFHGSYAWNLERIVIVKGSITISLDLAPRPYNQSCGVYHRELNVLNVDDEFLRSFAPSSH